MKPGRRLRCSDLCFIGCFSQRQIHLTSWHHEYISEFWCSPSYVLIFHWKNQIVLAPSSAWRVLRCSGRNAAGITDSKASLISEDTFAHGNCCKPATRKTAHHTCTVNIAEAWGSVSPQELLKELKTRWVDKVSESFFWKQIHKSANTEAEPGLRLWVKEWNCKHPDLYIPFIQLFHHSCFKYFTTRRCKFCTGEGRVLVGNHWFLIQSIIEYKLL